MGSFAYQSSRDEKGRLVVHDVPIFVECERGKLEFDKEWLTQAFSAAQVAEKENYHPPLHVRHHGGDGDGVRAAGFFRITKVGPIKFKGESRQAIYADLVLTDERVAGEVLEDKLLYRSVEIADFDSPGITSLALLDHEAPFLELPLLTVNSPWNMESAVDLPEGLACFTTDNSTRILFSNEGFEEKKSEKKSSDSDSDSDDSDSGSEGDHSEPDGDDKMGMNVEMVCAAIQDGTISIGDFDAIMAAIAAKRDAGPQQTHSAQQPASAAVPGGMMKKDNETAALLGRIAGLEAKLTEQEALASANADVATALQTLNGKPLGADLEANLRAFRTAHGAEAFKAYVEALDKAIGPADFNGMVRFTNNENNPVVAKYAENGEAATGKAAQFSAKWRQLNGMGATKLTEERYVELNMARELKTNG